MSYPENPFGPWPCDPKKYKSCKKTGCFINGDPCKLTFHHKYRADQEGEKPKEK